jgi:uncharacterized protein YeaO (DUF488 family)
MLHQARNAMAIRIKRVYEDRAADDGHRILVDRLWPRGLSKERAAVDEWLRDVAPSAALRSWFGHDPARWAEFKRRYRLELKVEPASTALSHLRSLARRQRVTLLYGAKDEMHNQAVALAELIDSP